MCGILIHPDNALIEDSLRSAVKCRGPDHFATYEHSNYVFESSILELRGVYMPQPRNQHNSTFLYNGQIYHPSLINDTEFVHSLLLAKDYKKLFELEGEFAFVFFDNAETIVFGRDVLGRRSLGFELTPSGIIVSSIGVSLSNFEECDGNGTLYFYNIKTKKLTTEVYNRQLRINRTLKGTFSTELLKKTLENAVAKRSKFLKTNGISVLFSGGLDCTILVKLLNNILPSNLTIELVNVSFENKRTNENFMTPDRKLCLKTFEEVKNSRTQLKLVDVPYILMEQHKEKVLSLMNPMKSVMDFSIAVAFYFAVKKCSNKVVFSGLGADELFAGYSRHTRQADNADKLANELEMDFSRLPHRNLGRDDRVSACFGVEMRYPFLDAEVVQCAFGMPLNAKTDGVETKIVLRTLASELGLQGVVGEKKRAIQFGARSAKMEIGSGKTKGHQIYNIQTDNMRTE